MGSCAVCNLNKSRSTDAAMVVTALTGARKEAVWPHTTREATAARMTASIVAERVTRDGLETYNRDDDVQILATIYVAHRDDSRFQRQHCSTRLAARRAAAQHFCR